MNLYPQDRLLYLSDAEFTPAAETLHVPVIDGWDWEISQSGKGCLHAPDGGRHCLFDLSSCSLSFEPDGEPFTAPGLTASLVQEMGERYAYDVAFSEEEREAYDSHAAIRENTKKMHDRQVRDLLRGVIQLERKDGAWMAHVDTEKVRELSGIESSHVVSAEQGHELFNAMSERLHARPLKDPSGYMALKGNLYEFIHKEYQNQYENILQAIDNQMVDGTGYGVSHILDTLQTTVRKNISEYLPKGEKFGDLRFLRATDEQKQAVRDFVKCRVSKTLTYEKKRSYEKSALEKTDLRYREAGERLGRCIRSAEQPPGREM